MKILRVVAYLSMLVYLSSTVVSQGCPIPEHYWGYVFIKGEKVPDGTNVSVIGATSGYQSSTLTKDALFSMSLEISCPESDWYAFTDNEPLMWYINDKATTTPTPGSDKVETGNHNIEFDMALGTVPKPTCSDGIKNQNEEGVDCGGPCEPCTKATTIAPSGKATTTTLGGTNTTTTTKSLLGDLFSKIKPKTTTTLGTTPLETTTIDPTGATCYDGIKNQNEEGVDCGGPCKPCRRSWLPLWLIIGLVIVLIFVSIILVAGVIIYIKR